jgi:DNA-binding PadR family transcriptional regulator
MPAVPARRPDPADFLPLASDATFILLALAAQPLHGYGIIRDVEARSDGQVVLQTGALYRMLRRLLQDGFLEERARPPGAESDDERRRYYTLTPFGRSVLDAEVARMSKLVRAARLTAGGKRPRLI